MATRDSLEEAGEGYFASISDLMVGILFVFLLLLTVFALNYARPADEKDIEIEKLKIENQLLMTERDAAKKENESLQTRIRDLLVEANELRIEINNLKTRNAKLDDLIVSVLTDLEKLERNLADLSNENGRLQLVRRQLLEELSKRLRSRNVPVEITDQYDVLRMPSEALFQLGSSDFTMEGRVQATALLEEMAALLPCYATEAPASNCTTRQAIFETILFEGHTDTLRANNWRLSTDRARAVLDLAEDRAAVLPTLRNRAGQPLLGLAGYGESRTLPGIPGTDPRNRRIEVRFLLAAFQEADLDPLRQSLSQLRRRLDAIRAARP